jgi:hypothetical protein
MMIDQSIIKPPERENVESRTSTKKSARSEQQTSTFSGDTTHGVPRHMTY